MPANDQLMSWDAIAAEVTAGRMLWSGAAQSSTAVATWLGFKTYVTNDGTNPAALADTQCPRYDALLARAVVMQPPTNLVATDGGAGTLMASWNAPVSGPAPASYDIQYYNGGSTFGAMKNVPASQTTDTGTGYPANAQGSFQVRSKNASGGASAWASSNTVTITGGV